MPTSASLVTNLPADFNTFGQAVDTSMSELLGGTTGQILSKTSGTNMDFTWINNDQGDITGVTAGTGISVTSPTGPVPTVAIDATVTTLTGTQTLTNKTLTSPALTTPTISTLTTNGDLVYGTGSGALSRLGIGSTAQVLTVTSGVPAWATPSGSSGPAFRAYRATTDQSFTASTWSKVQLNAESYDTDNCFDSTTNYRFTPTKSGYYQMNASIAQRRDGTAEMAQAIRKNGTAISQYFVVNNYTFAGVVNAGGADLIYLNGSTDYLELYVFSGGTSPHVNSAASENVSYFSGVWIRS